MTTDVSDDFAAFHRWIEDNMRPYGQDFAMRGAEPGAQRWGDPAIALAVVGIVLWVTRVAIEAAIRALVTRRVTQKTDSQELTDLLDRVEAIETRFDQLVKGEASVRDSLDTLQRDVASAFVEFRERIDELQDLDMDTTSLQVVLVKLGLTQRRAKHAANDMGPRLIQLFKGRRRL